MLSLDRLLVEGESNGTSELIAPHRELDRIGFWQFLLRVIWREWLVNYVLDIMVRQVAGCMAKEGIIFERVWRGLVHEKTR